MEHLLIDRHGEQSEANQTWATDWGLTWVASLSLAMTENFKQA